MLNPLYPDRVRKISGSFAFVEHRFLHNGFWADLDHDPLLLYFFLVLVGDRFGLSYYSYDKICTLLRLSVDDYIEARNTLIRKDLVAFDGRLFQVLSLPEHPRRTITWPLQTDKQMEKSDPATISQIIARCFGNDHENG